MMLSDLDAKFVRLGLDRRSFLFVDNLIDAQGIWFGCPKCEGIWFGCPKCAGRHRILIWFAGRDVPDDLTPSPRWEASGQNIRNLTVSPSIANPVPCGWHGWIRNGEIVNA